MGESSPSCAEAIDAFIADLELAGRSLRTLGPYRSYLKPLSGNVAELSDDTLRALVLARLRTNPRTAFALHAVLASFCEYCVSRRWLTSNPMRKIPRPRVKPRPHRYLTKDELARVWQHAQRDATLALIVRLLMLGLRARELLGLQWDDVALEKQELRLTRTKGQKPRRVWLDGPTVALLAAVRGAAGEPVIRCRYEALLERVIRLGRDASVPWLRPHDFRRTFASQALLAGMPHSTIRTLAGWSTDKMLEHYARSVLEESALKEAERFDLTSRLLDA